jgi:hypothetical protein
MVTSFPQRILDPKLLIEDCALIIEYNFIEERAASNHDFGNSFDLLSASA